MSHKTTIQRFLFWLTILISGGVLLFTVAFLFIEQGWAEAEQTVTSANAFTHGSIGTELIPELVLNVLPDLLPDKFPDGNSGDPDWLRKYGFIPPDALKRLLPDQQEGLNVHGNERLPVGFTSTPLRPLSSYPSPIRFVGITCATCHSTLVRTNELDQGKLVLGPGNWSLDLLAFFENLKAGINEREALNLDNIIAANARKSRALSPLEKAAIAAWITAARNSVLADARRNDEPRVGHFLNDSRQNRAGPLRSNPFQTLVRTFFDRPGLSATQNELGMGFVKFAAVFEQNGKEWAQFDGTMRKLYSRSAFAAVAAGATVQSLSQEGVIRNVTASSDYVATLRAPQWEAVFPELPINRARAERGLTVYRTHCSVCHGYRDLNSREWKAEATSRLGEVVPLGEINTDPERITLAHQDKLPDAFRDFFGKLPYGVRESFPDRHPFAVQYDLNSQETNDVRPATGYLNAPITAAFLRVPFLHNASVLTMRELINLDKRREYFYRGKNLYDATAIGLTASDTPDSERPWRFDTSLRGNSNRGHDYPWPYSDQISSERRAALEDLLEYLKFL